MARCRWSLVWSGRLCRCCGQVSCGGGPVSLGSLWLGGACTGVASSGLVRSGLVRSGAASWSSVGYGPHRFGKAGRWFGPLRQVLVCIGRPRSVRVRFGSAGCAQECFGGLGFGSEWPSTVGCGPLRYGTRWLGRSWRGRASRGRVCSGALRYGQVWFAKVRCGVQGFAVVRSHESL